MQGITLKTAGLGMREEPDFSKLSNPRMIESFLSQENSIFIEYLLLTDVSQQRNSKFSILGGKNERAIIFQDTGRRNFL